jgi:hypothetical protein
MEGPTVPLALKGLYILTRNVPIKEELADSSPCSKRPSIDAYSEPH